MRLEVHTNYSPYIIHLSEIHSFIQNNKHYHGIYQNKVEMVIVCSLKVILTYNSWEFWLETFWEFSDNEEQSIFELISIRNGQWEALPIRSIQHYNGSQQDSWEMTLFLHCSTFLHEFSWVFRPESLLNMKYRAYTSEHNIICIIIFPKEINSSPKAQSLHWHEYGVETKNSWERVLQ